MRGLRSLREGRSECSADCGRGHTQEGITHILFGRIVLPHNNSLKLTQLACGKLQLVLPTKLPQNGGGNALAARVPSPTP
jgi:hypothetical protein